MDWRVIDLVVSGSSLATESLLEKFLLALKSRYI